MRIAVGMVLLVITGALIDSNWAFLAFLTGPATVAVLADATI